MEDTTPKIDSIVIEDSVGIFENTPCIFSVNIEFVEVTEEENFDSLFFAQN